MRDVRQIQKQLLEGDLYRQVKSTEQALRHRSEYDIGSAGDREFAILCWAIERSANHTQGTAVTLHGIQLEIQNLRILGGV